MTSLLSCFSPCCGVLPLSCLLFRFDDGGGYICHMFGMAHLLSFYRMFSLLLNDLNLFIHNSMVPVSFTAISYLSKLSH